LGERFSDHWFALFADHWKMAAAALFMVAAAIAVFINYPQLNAQQKSLSRMLETFLLLPV